MKKFFMPLLLAVSLAVPIGMAEASAAPAAPAAPTVVESPAGGYMTSARAATIYRIMLRSKPSLRTKACAAAYVSLRKAGKILSKVGTGAGYYPVRNQRKGARKALRAVCY